MAVFKHWLVAIGAAALCVSVKASQTVTLPLNVMSKPELGERQIPSLVASVAHQRGVPPQIFYSLVLAESRSRTQAGAKPWPWTINHRGTPHFFQTREDAYAFASLLDQQGDHSFDIGIAQVNWKWHKQRFDYDLWGAFEPHTNLSVAAGFLREQYNRPACNRWEVAVGCYHRPARSPKDLEIADRYAERVLKIWGSL